MPEMTPARAGLGCANLLTIVGGFGAGVYLGLNSARGIEVDHEGILKYSPAAVSGFFGFMAGADLARDPNAVIEIVKDMPHGLEEQAAGCMMGCGPIIGGVSSAAVASLGTFVGYIAGKSLV